MLTLKTRSGLALVAPLALLLVGCGGDGGSSASSGRASLRMTMAWPAPNRAVPNAANSVVTIVTVRGKEVARALFTRPGASRGINRDGGSTTILLQRLPAGEATVGYAAYPSADGTGVAQATGSSTGTLLPNGVMSVTATMASTVATLALTPSPATVAKDGTVNLTVAARDAQDRVVLLETNDRERLSWTSDAEGTATVSDGIVFGVAAGTANVTVSMVVNDAGATKTATAPVTVTAPARVLQSIVVTPSFYFLYPTETRPFTAIATYSDATTADVTSSVAWSSSNTRYVAIDAGGLATGIAYGGTSTITASLEAVAGSAAVSTVD